MNKQKKELDLSLEEKAYRNVVHAFKTVWYSKLTKNTMTAKTQSCIIRIPKY